MASLDTLPVEVIVCYIFPYLKPEDIFNIGECSERMKRIVLENSHHPLSTHLQYIKNRTIWCDRKKTVYDNEAPFRKMEKCSKNDCKCQKFSQRKHMVDLKIVNCDLCVEVFNPIESYCYNHDILLYMFTQRSLCNDCVNKSVPKNCYEDCVLYCNSCYEEITEYKKGF